MPADVCRLSSRCRIAYYCSRECQVKDWKYTHKTECPGFAKLIGDDIGRAEADKGDKLQSTPVRGLKMVGIP